MAVNQRRLSAPNKAQRGIGALRNKHVRLGVVVLLMFVSLVCAIPCFAAGESTSRADIVWTEEELAFMESHPVIRLGVDPDFMPFEFIDEDGEYKGIAADYLALVSERTGLQFEAVKGLSWPEAYEMALEGRIDVLPAVGRTIFREENFLFSKPYYYYKRVIVTRDTDTEISGIDDLEGFTVAVQRNSSHHSYLLSYPNINLSLYDSVEAAITAVATGEEKAFIGNLATSNYFIRTNGLTNLRFVSFEAEKQQALYFAVRKDLPELVDIFNKALDTISESEKLAVHDKWVKLTADMDFGPIMRSLYIAGALIAAMLAVSYFWIVRLGKEIRRRKQIQLDLEKAILVADAANEFKSSFLAVMSHEIRTPLNAIMGMSYLMKKTGITTTQSMYIDRITQAANNMLNIINDILDFSKIEAGKVELEIASFSMDKLILNVVNIVSYKIDEQGIRFRFSRDPHVPNWFFGDSRRIEQVLLNVLSNAVKFTKAGEVSLDVRLVGKENDRYHISFIIRDTGIGMTEEQMNRLFMPFVQGDRSIYRRFGGTGLGLFIVKNFVDMMGGEIKVFSTPGEGTNFIINLPLDIDKEKEAAFIKALSDNHFSDVRTLVLEKSVANINLIESYLSTFGIQCELASSEAGAISILEAANGKFAKPFDLFIIDHDTPSEGGFSFVERLRKNRKIVKIPKIIMLLPMMRDDLFDKLDEYGIDMGIVKPIIPSVLVRGILDVFNLKTALSGFQPSAGMETENIKLDRIYNVLLAEDNKTNQLIVKSLLDEAGISTMIANNGREAVELYKEHMDNIDLILMDLYMPVMDGYEASEKIRGLSAKVPIVALTADVISGVEKRCEQSGIHHYISKPFNPEHLVQTVINIILDNENDVGKYESVLDRRLGLANMGGNEELYQMVLKEYRNENQDTLTRMEAAVREKRYTDAAQIAHKIKSSSGSIGARQLQDAAASLQMALKEEKEEEIGKWHDSFSKLLRRLLEEINQIQEDTEMVQAKEGDPQC